MKSLFPIISHNSLTKDLLPAPPNLVYKKPPNLRTIFNRNPTSSKPGTYPCHRTRCKTCPLVDDTPTITTPNTPNSYSITTSATCTSSNLIYNLKCQNCEAFYIGETTTPLSTRMNGHRDSLNSKPNLPVATHALSHNKSFDSCYRVQVAKVLPPNTSTIDRRTWESSYISVLGGLKPPGLNKKH